MRGHYTPHATRSRRRRLIGVAVPLTVGRGARGGDCVERGGAG